VDADVTTLDAWQASAAQGMTEKALQEYVRRAAKTLRWLCYHTHNSQRSEPGFPDLVLVRESRLIFTELKSAKGRLSPPQVEWLGRLDALGVAAPAVEVYVWRPVDWVSGGIQRILT
jgi:hypothetical protein